MATAITAPTYDPIPTATSLADKYIAARQQILDTQSASATAAEKGLTELNSALTAFQNSLATLTGLNKTLYAQAATFSDTTIGSASATSTAAAGTYSFFVEKLAAASQVSYAGLPAVANVSGKISIEMDGTAAFEVDFGAASRSLTPRELAAAINGADGNGGKITASVVSTGNGKSELVLTARDTGEASEITLDLTDLDDLDASADLSTALDPSRARTVVQAADAVIHVGGEGGTAITQASNTFTAIEGVKMTFTKAQASGAAPVTLSVGPDDKNTTANVQGFVDAFNKLKTALNKLTAAGDPSKGVGGGAFAHDAGIRSLNDRLNALLRPANGDSLATFGIIATRSGTLELNTERLLSQLALKPEGLDALIGAASATASTGIAGALDSYIKGWSNSVDGQIKQRREQNSNVQLRLSDRQAALDLQHEAAYQRYLRQFTQLQTMQGVMNQNVSLFDALFSSDKN